MEEAGPDVLTWLPPVLDANDSGSEGPVHLIGIVPVSTIAAEYVMPPSTVVK